MRLRLVLLATASSVAISSMAAAADLAVRPALKAPPPVLTWTGPYIGLNVGAARHDWSFTDKNEWAFEDGGTFWTSSKSGFIGGVQAGYNWQSGTFVYGVEADFNWLGLKKTDTFGFPFTFNPVNVKTEVNWLATFRGRIGLTSLNQTMVYVTGGLAVAGVKNRWGVGYTGPAFPGAPPANWDSDFVDDKVRFGWTAGLGVEHMISQNWSFKAEVLYVDLGTRSVNVTPFGGPAFGTYTSEFSNSLVTARVGVNFKW